jgi:hypothetical protein
MATDLFGGITVASGYLPCRCFKPHIVYRPNIMRHFSAFNYSRSFKRGMVHAIE